MSEPGTNEPLRTRRTPEQVPLAMSSDAFRESFRRLRANT